MNPLVFSGFGFEARREGCVDNRLLEFEHLHGLFNVTILFNGPSWAFGIDVLNVISPILIWC